jgi:hypothetical protein
MRLNSLSHNFEEGPAVIENLRSVLPILICVAFLVIVVFCAVALIIMALTGKRYFDIYPIEILKLYYVTGVPFLLITFYKITEGPMKMDFGPIKFEGSSGPIILWIIAFLCLCYSTRILWK